VQLSAMRRAAGVAGLALVIVLGCSTAGAQTGGQDDSARLESLRAEGRYSEAITVLQRVIAAQEGKSGLDNPMGVVLLNNLGELHYKLGLNAEAVPIYERALAISDKTIKVDNPLTAILLRNLGTVYQLQGRRGEAARLYARSILQFEKHMPATRIQLASTLNNLATLYQDIGRLQDAETLLQRVLKTYQDGLPAGHPYVSTALHNLGQLYKEQDDYAKAEPLMSAALRNIEGSLDRDHPLRGALLGNLGSLHMRKGEWAKAVVPLDQALEIYRKRAQRGLENLEGELGGLVQADLARHKTTVAAFVTSAMNFMLSEPFRDPSRIDLALGAAIISRVLQATEWLPSSASSSLAKMAARRVKGDGPLATIIRERQDLVLEWQARNKRAFDRLLKGEAPDSKDRLADKARLAEIDRRLADLDGHLARDFPDYAAVANPQPVPLSTVQAPLRDNEVLVAFIETPARSWVWAITKTGLNIAPVALSGDGLAEEVAALRCGLDAADWVDPAGWPAATAAELERKQRQETRYQRCRTLHPRYVASGTLPFDAMRSHGLYKRLLGSMEKEIAGKQLIIVPSPALTQLPFNTLVTEPPGVGMPDDAEGYRATKWLGARQAITILPSIASLAALRRGARTTRAQKPWIGFGNPVLDGPSGDPEQGRLAREARSRQSCGPAAPSARLAARGSRAAIGDLFQGTLVDVAQLRRQTPLPETAGELCDAAKRLGATEEDVWLGSRATETAIKGLSARGLLQNYATLHFATHGLVAGALKGVAEPALMLTPPAAPSEEDDGLLTASEVMQLKLDAEWVVLSACNTAAGGAEGAEAMSGLARAFFYAGARALLVSHWEVESDAAVALTTKALAEFQADPRVGRAEALRRSMLALASDKGNVGNAHPSVWAPFLLVGEGAR
jgi:CHAT domain-containing protein/tetratricopeptide (TPR) repeat protein